MTTDPYADVLCAHGRLSCVECGVVPRSLAQKRAILRSELVAFMASHALSRLEYEDPDSRIVMERHPSAFVRPAVEVQPLEDLSDVCACGHSLATQHAPDGCLNGCAISKCNAEVKRA